MGDTIPPDGRDTCWPHAPLRPQTPASPVGYPAGWRWCDEVMFVGAVCVEAHARRDGDVVTVAAKGLALQLTKNQRLHPQEEARIRAHERATIDRALADIAPPAGPWDVIVTREGPRTLDDVNATTSIKGVEDAVAAWLGVDDGDRARFRCRAVQALTRGFGVVITIKGRASW